MVEATTLITTLHELPSLKAAIHFRQGENGETAELAELLNMTVKSTCLILLIVTKVLNMVPPKQIARDHTTTCLLLQSTAT